MNLLVSFLVIVIATFLGVYLAYKYFELQVDLKEANQKVELLEEALAKKIAEVRE